MTFKNKNFIRRDYECTNVVFCKSETAPNENWVECPESELEKSGATRLYIQTVGRGIDKEPLQVEYFGWL